MRSKIVSLSLDEIGRKPRAPVSIQVAKGNHQSWSGHAGHGRLTYYAAQVFLVHVLSRVRGLVSVRAFSSALYKSRYALLYPKQGLFLQKSTFQCFKEADDTHSRALEK